MTLEQALLVVGVVSVLQPPGMWGVSWPFVSFFGPSQRLLQILADSEALPPRGCLRNPEAEGRGWGVRGLSYCDT